MTRAHAELRELEAEAREVEFERALEARAFRKESRIESSSAEAIFEFGSQLSMSGGCRMRSLGRTLCVSVQMLDVVWSQFWRSLLNQGI